MDFTPTMLSDTVGASVRRTSDAFDLAMTVVFESGLQHLGVTPADMARQPEFVTEFLTRVPASWDETRLLAGHPGSHVVMARRKGDTWFIGGMNAEGTSRTFNLEPDLFDGGWAGHVLRDGPAPRDVLREEISGGSSTTIVMPPAGGFVAVLESAP